MLANTIIYFTFPNPDGWRRGSVGDTEKGPGVFFQRYNGNGIDPNRDWPDIGFSFRDYSGGSEPETRAFQAFYRQVENRGGEFAAGDDLHGQPFADALSYTLMPHGRHDIDKDYRIREASKLINRAQYEATKWSPLIVDNDEHAEFCEDTGAVGDRVLGDLRADVGLGLRHDQLHDDRHARRLVRLERGPRRGRHRQRDVVLAPRSQHRLRSARRAAARGRQQGDHLLAHRGHAASARDRVLGRR